MNVQYTIFVRQVWFVAIFYDQRVNITLKHKMFNKLRLLHLCSLGIITTKVNWTDDFRSEINFSHFLFVHSELDIEFIIISLCVLTEIHNIMANQITCQQWQFKKKCDVSCLEYYIIIFFAKKSIAPPADGQIRLKLQLAYLIDTLAYRIISICFASSKFPSSVFGSLVWLFCLCL